MSTVYGHVVCIGVSTGATVAIGALGVDNFWYVIVLGVTTAICRSVGQFEGEKK